MVDAAMGTVLCCWVVDAWAVGFWTHQDHMMSESRGRGRASHQLHLGLRRLCCGGGEVSPARETNSRWTTYESKTHHTTNEVTRSSSDYFHCFAIYCLVRLKWLVSFRAYTRSWFTYLTWYGVFGSLTGDIKMLTIPPYPSGIAQRVVDTRAAFSNRIMETVLLNRNEVGPSLARPPWN